MAPIHSYSPRRQTANMMRTCDNLGSQKPPQAFRLGRLLTLLLNAIGGTTACKTYPRPSLIGWCKVKGVWVPWRKTKDKRNRLLDQSQATVPSNPSPIRLLTFQSTRPRSLDIGLLLTLLSPSLITNGPKCPATRARPRLTARNHSFKLKSTNKLKSQHGT